MSTGSGSTTGPLESSGVVGVTGSRIGGSSGSGRVSTGSGMTGPEESSGVVGVTRVEDRRKLRQRERVDRVGDDGTGRVVGGGRGDRIRLGRIRQRERVDRVRGHRTGVVGRDRRLGLRSRCGLGLRRDDLADRVGRLVHDGGHVDGGLGGRLGRRFRRRFRRGLGGLCRSGISRCYVRLGGGGQVADVDRDVGEVDRELRGGGAGGEYCEEGEGERDEENPEGSRGRCG